MKKVFLFVAIFGIISSVILSNIKLKINNKISNESNKIYNQLYVLGDSLSDTGALVGVINAVSSLIKILLGNDNWALSLEEPFYQNRSFSNGKVAAEVLADKLNLKLKPGWNFDFNGKNFNQEGNNYALGGAQASRMDSSDLKALLLNNFTIEKQVDALLKQHKKICDDDLVFFEIGSNDLMFQVLDANLINENRVIEKSISSQEQALKKLINYGSKNILLMNSPNLSQVPNYKKTDKAQVAAKICKNYNDKWFNMINNIKNDYPEINIKIFNLYDIFSKLLEKFASNKGNIDQVAVEYRLSFKTFLSGKIKPIYNFPVSDKTINNYFFFDFVHPTKNVHTMVGEMLYQLAMNKIY